MELFDIKELFRTKSDKEIARIKELVETIDRANAELKEMTGSTTEDRPQTRRGRPPKKLNGQGELPVT